MFTYRKAQYCLRCQPSQINLYIHSNLNQNPSKLFCRYQKTYFKFDMEIKKGPESQHSIKLKEQNSGD